MMATTWMEVTALFFPTQSRDRDYGLCALVAGDAGGCLCRRLRHGARRLCMPLFSAIDPDYFAPPKKQNKTKQTRSTSQTQPTSGSLQTLSWARATRSMCCAWSRKHGCRTRRLTVPSGYAKPLRIDPQSDPPPKKKKKKEHWVKVIVPDNVVSDISAFYINGGGNPLGGPPGDVESFCMFAKKISFTHGKHSGHACNQYWVHHLRA